LGLNRRESVRFIFLLCFFGKGKAAGSAVGMWGWDEAEITFSHQKRLTGKMFQRALGREEGGDA